MRNIGHGAYCLAHSKGSANGAIIASCHSYIERASGPASWVHGQSQGPARALSLVQCSALTILKFLVFFQHDASRFQVTRGSVSYKAGPQITHHRKSTYKLFPEFTALAEFLVKLFSCKAWSQFDFPKKKNPEIRNRVQRVYLGENSRKHHEGVRQ